MNDFDNVIDIAKLICGFIFSHSEEMPADVTEMVFGISTTYISVRYKGTCIGEDNLKQDIISKAVSLSLRHGLFSYGCSESMRSSVGIQSSPLAGQ